MPVWLLVLAWVGATLALGTGSLAASAMAGEGEAKPEGVELVAAGEGSEAEEGPAELGNSVALSADGQTALVGGPFDSEGRGAAWVFVRREGAWKQVAKLTAGAEEIGAGHFGRAVAISADGSTALVGAPGNRAGVGAAWVFHLDEGVWSAPTRLTPKDEQGVGHFGHGLALSGDGRTALVGATGENQSAGGVWAFTSSGGGWREQAHLTDAEGDPEAHFGRTLALSFDGSTALVGGPSDGAGVGAAWIFERTGPEGQSWAQQPGRLTGAGEVGAGQFGGSVALSPDGSTAMVAAPHDAEGIGAAWVFTRSGSQWSAQGGKLESEIGAREQDFGSGVALSGDGDVALIGEAAAKGSRGGRTGGAWMFKRADGSWTRFGFFLGSEQPGEQFGRSVSISSDGETSLVGALGEEGEAGDGRMGAAWVFQGPPVLKEPPPDNEEEPPGPTGGSSGGQSAGSSSSQSTSAGGQVLAVSETRPASCGVRLVSSRLSVDRKSRAVVRLRASGTGRCAGRVTLSISKRVRRVGAGQAGVRKVTIGAGAFTLVAGHNGTVRVKLTRAGRALLAAGHGKLTVSLRLVRSRPAPTQTHSARAHLVAAKANKRVRPPG
ncbi:MAG TPA: hypothetical protein VL972_02380 [Solirubrobacteraceae bacterium]|nr:hypothetical protein [Solirubrobacteraceae bacterium]